MKKLIFSLMLLTASLSGLAKGNTLTLRVLETSDVHGSFFPYDLLDRKPKPGSMARVSSYVNKLRKQYGKNVLLLDNGDILQGQPVSYYSNFIDTTQTNIAAQVINYLGYDAETIGNHDVEPGHRVYDKWIAAVKCPVLGANVINTASGAPYLKPYTIIERNGCRIAVFGMLTPAIPNWLPKNIWSGLRFDEMVSTAKRWMKIMKEQEKADVVIGLFHSGKSGGITTPTYEEDASEKVAREVPGFDLVLFGHDHTRHLDKVVNVAGDTVLCMDPANNEAGARGYCEKPVLSRMIVILAGSAMNFVLPVVLFFGIFFFSGVSTISAGKQSGDIARGGLLFLQKGGIQQIAAQNSPAGLIDTVNCQKEAKQDRQAGKDAPGDQHEFPYADPGKASSQQRQQHPSAVQRQYRDQIDRQHGEMGQQKIDQKGRCAERQEESGEQ